VAKPPEGKQRDIKFILHLRRDLRNTNESIDRIAEACGFWDRNHFTRVFTQERKVPPTRYRHSSTTL